MGTYSVQLGTNNLNFCFVSNGNSSTTSSLGIMDLEIYQENVPSSPTIKIGRAHV